MTNKTPADGLQEAIEILDRIDEKWASCGKINYSAICALRKKIEAARRAAPGDDLRRELEEIVPATPLPPGMSRDVVADIKRMIARKAASPGGVGTDTRRKIWNLLNVWALHDKDHFEKYFPGLKHAIEAFKRIAPLDEAPAESELREAIKSLQTANTSLFTHKERTHLHIALQAARDHLERQAAGEGVDVWQHISTAPTDGERILVEDASGVQFIAYNYGEGLGWFFAPSWACTPVRWKARTQGAAVDVVDRAAIEKVINETIPEKHRNSEKGLWLADILRAYTARLQESGHLPAPAKESTVPPIDSFASRCEGAEIINTALGGAVDPAPSSEKGEA